MRTLIFIFLLLLHSPISAADIIVTTDKPNPSVKKYILTIINGIPKIVLAKVTHIKEPTTTTPPTGTLVEKVTTLTTTIIDPKKEENIAAVYVLYKLTANTIRSETVTVAKGLKDLRDNTHNLLVSRNAVTLWADWRRGIAKIFTDENLDTSSSPEKIANVLDQICVGMKVSTKQSGKKLKFITILKTILPILEKILSDGEFKLKDLLPILLEFLSDL